MARILLDTCVWGGALEPLSEAGHDVIWSGDWSSDPGDEAILKFAYESNRILVTLDKDFGELAIMKGLPHRGLIRLSGFRVSMISSAVEHLLQMYAADLKAGALITADPLRVRIRL
ncbi:MAG: DUF5615 family PIN-like protein [Opitutales bacterium]|nr:DUF5615 family PIN-like protein [Opitutales bacterium]